MPADVVHILTVQEILHALGPDIQLSSCVRRQQALILQAVDQLDADTQRRLTEVAQAKSDAIRAEQERVGNGRRVRRWIGDEQILSDSSSGDVSESDFLSVPSADVIKDCYQQFFEATSNDTMQSMVCSVCARRMRVAISNFRDVPLNAIPNRHRLQPAHPHSNTELVQGMLLEPSTIGVPDDIPFARLCSQCWTALQSQSNHPPRYALANGLWLGEVPFLLDQLTMPEHLLIARKFPRVYIMKLFARSRRGHPDTLQQALKGNVSTFDLNTHKIVDMLDGTLLPQRPDILPSVLSICYVGRRLPSRDSLRGTFRVRRSVVRQALIWLKVHNSKYYGDITVDDGRLSQLPSDDIPEEIWSTIRHDAEDVHIDEEQAGYVPDDENDVPESDS